MEYILHELGGGLIVALQQYVIVSLNTNGEKKTVQWACTNFACHFFRHLQSKNMDTVDEGQRHRSLDEISVA